MAATMTLLVSSGHERRRGHKEWNLYFRRTPVGMVADRATGKVAAVRLEINKEVYNVLLVSACTD